ncbi:MAG: hypothetical protein HUU15_11705 [Candidatus Brocadiae bacterium]|nr:hypothetical protein [Candidatus Brocadiia bacterium]
MAADKDQTIGRLAVSRGIISQSQLRQCLEEQQKSARPLPLAVILLKKGFLDDSDLETLMEASERLGGVKTTSQENTTAHDHAQSSSSAYSDALGQLMDVTEGGGTPAKRSRTVEGADGMNVAAMADAMEQGVKPKTRAQEATESLLGDALKAMDGMSAEAPVQHGGRRQAPPQDDLIPPQKRKTEPPATRKKDDDGPAKYDKVSETTGLVDLSALPDLGGDDEPAPPPKKAAGKSAPPPEDEMLIPPKRKTEARRTTTAPPHSTRCR